MFKMRKLQVIYSSNEKKLMELVNNYFAKAEEVGYPILSTTFVKEPFGGHFAYIEYETIPQKKN